MILSRLIARSGFSLVALVIVILIGGTWWLLSGVGRNSTTIHNAQDKLPNDEFERRVRAYLLDNPEVVAEALQRLEQKREAASASAAREVIKARADEIFRDPASPISGNAEGDVTMVEFFDYNCPYCRKVTPSMAKAEADDPKLRIVYKEFPILGPNSTFAAKAALAAHRQGKYVSFHKALMEAKGTIVKETVLDIAARTGLDMKQLQSDMATPAIQAAIQHNLELARALRIEGTPAFVIGNEIVTGAMDIAQMQRLIGTARQSK